MILADLQRGVRPRNMLAVGEFGTGKTATVRSLCQPEPAGILPPGVLVSYVNCSEENTQNRVIRTVLRTLGVEVKTGFPSDYYLQLLKEKLARVLSLVFILDEVDKLVEHKDSGYEELFYTISRSLNNVVTILLTNRISLEATLLSGLDSRVRDTFRFERIEFGDYDAAELNSILTDRCRIGMRSGTYDVGFVAIIARKAYQAGLRARGLIDLARMAGEIADSHGSERITEDHVREGFQIQLHERELDIIKRLPPPQRALLGYVLLNSPTSTAAQKWLSSQADQYGIGQSSSAYHRILKELETIGVVIKKKRGLGRGRGADMILTVTPELASIVRASLEKTTTPHPTSVSVNQIIDAQSKNPKHTPFTQTRLESVTDSEIG